MRLVVVHEFDVIYPEGIAILAIEGLVAAGCEHEDSVCRLGIGRSEAIFLYRNDLATGVQGTHAMGWSHEWLIARLLGAVAVPDRYAVAILPLRMRSAETLVGSTYTLSMDMSVAILPTLLQEQIGLALVVSLDRSRRCESGCSGECTLGGNVALEIILEVIRTLGEGDTEVDISIRILGRCDRLDGLSPEDGTCHDDMDIEHLEYDHIQHFDIEACAVTIATTLR